MANNECTQLRVQFIIFVSRTNIISWPGIFSKQYVAIPLEGPRSIFQCPHGYLERIKSRQVFNCDGHCAPLRHNGLSPEGFGQPYPGNYP